MRLVEAGDGEATLRQLPRYPRLVDDLLSVQPGAYSPVAAHVCALAAGWVYASEPAALTTAMMDRVGLVGASCQEVAVHNDVMLIASTALFLRSNCGRLGILCYRGTEPQNLTSWMADFDVNPTCVPMRASTRGHEALTHLGFNRNLQVTWDEVVKLLERSTATLEALFVTGHSLGAAMAALAGVRLATGRREGPRFREKLRGIYTFGQPLVGNPEFAAICSEDPLLERGLFRHVYRNDVVPHLPGRSCGRFDHFGREFRVGSRGSWLESTSCSEQAADIVVSMFVVPTLTYWAGLLASTRWLGRLGYSWYYHLPQFYIGASTPRG